MHENEIAVIVDIDGTSLGTEQIRKGTFIECLSNMHKDRESIDRIYESTVGTNSDYLHRILQEEWHEFESKDLFDAFRAQRKNLFKEKTKDGIPVMPGVIESFEFFRNNGIPLGAYTSTDRTETTENLSKAVYNERRYNLLDYINECHITTGDEVLEGKPSPEGYLKTAKKMGIQQFGNVIGFDDSPHGILSLLKAGMIPIWIPDLIKPKPGTMVGNLAIISNGNENVTVRVCGTMKDAIPFIESIINRCKGPNAVRAEH